MKNREDIRLRFVGYPGVFTNWHTATTEDYEWIRIQKLSGADDRTKIAPVIKNKN